MKLIFDIRKTEEYLEWFESQTEKTKIIIDARLDRIAYFGHFGTVKRFDGLVELKWKSGLRIYTYQFDERMLIVLLGGNKHGQSRDIRKAKSILTKILKTP